MKQIFRGYLIGNKNFVGSWRMYNENLNAIPLEGPFALSRIEVPPARPAEPHPDDPPHPAAVITPESTAV